MTSKDQFINVKQYNKNNSLFNRASEIDSANKTHNSGCLQGGINEDLSKEYGSMFYYSISMKGSKDGIRGIVEDFAGRHLRVSVNEDEKLELDVGYHWKNKSSSQPVDVEQQARSGTSRQHTDRDGSLYYNLATLFFSEIATQNALDIDLLDTMFFQPDHSICYLYKDARKGLIKTKQRGINACEIFLKRKVKKREHISSKERLARKYKSINSLTEERSEKSIKEELGYIALLKYKDGTFLRLKESDLRSIFTNPLYANEKFRHHNCTQYIQSLPQEGTDEFRIHFTWQKYKDDPLAKAATSYQLGACDYGERAALRREMQDMDQLVFLYFTIFEICSFICIHYNKRVESATFHFVKEGENWALAGIEAAKVVVLEQREYIKANLWEQGRKVTFGQLKENDKEIFKLKEEAKSQFYKKIENFFDQTNSNIRNDMLGFVKGKINNVKRTSDKLLSRNIFQILHPQKKNVNLYDILDSPEHLARMISHHPSRKSKPKKQKEHLSLQQLKKKCAASHVQTKKHLQSRFVYRGIEITRDDFQEFEE